MNDMPAPELYLRSLHLELQDFMPEGYAANLIGGGVSTFIQVIGPAGEEGERGRPPVATVRAVTPGFILECKTDRRNERTGGLVWYKSRYVYEDPDCIDRLIGRLLLSCTKSISDSCPISVRLTGMNSSPPGG